MSKKEPEQLTVGEDWDRLVAMWANGRPDATMYIYMPVIKRFRLAVEPKRIGEVTLADLQAHGAAFAHQSPATIVRKWATISSLFTFALKAGIIPRNPCVMLKMPKVPDLLYERIMSEGDVAELIKQEPRPRNQVLLRVLYSAGIRASEASGLNWGDCKVRKDGGQISVLGKGQQIRTIRLPDSVWQALQSIRPRAAHADDPVFASDWGGRMSRTTITRMVRKAAERVGLKHVSAHWMRHAHASHSMEHGAPLPLIQRTLGHSKIDTTSRYLHCSPSASSSSYVPA